VGTPVGFWVSPSAMTASDVIYIIDSGIKKNAFIHPWMHLNECSLAEKDMDNFYRPIFEYVNEKCVKGELQNLSFEKILGILSPKTSAV
jgi:hypothetical protein